MAVNTTGVVTKVRLISSSVTKTATLDSDMNVVIRVTDKDDQVIEVEAAKDGIVITKRYSLAGLTCETE